MESYQIKMLAKQLEHYYVNADQSEKIIINCAMFAAGADAVGGIIPGLAIPATITSCVGTVWVMYKKLCDNLGISIKENTLKILARAALSNIAANLGGSLIAMFASMFIPGASILVSAAVAFIAVYLAGIVFLNLILKMAENSSDPYTFSDMSEREMKDTVKQTKLSKDDLKAAKEVFDQNK